MAKTKISEYDAISANNTDVDSINIAEGCAPSGINNAIREVMAHLKDFQTGASGDSLTVGGNLSVTGTVTIPDNAISGDKVEGGTINAITINTLTAGQVNFADNAKAIFGDGSDLQIYHDGTQSKIEDVGTGALSLRTNGTEIFFYDSTNAQFMSRFVVGGAVNLYHNGSAKLATTATGIDVTGLTDTDTLNVSGNTTLGDASTDTVTVNGYMGVRATPAPYYGIVLGNSSAITGDANPRGISSSAVYGSDATGLAAALFGQVRTTAAAYTMANAVGARLGDASKGAGSTITNQHGVYIEDQTQGTNNYGITSAVSSGTNKWNIYASGTAANYFGGRVLLGDTDGSVYDTNAGSDVGGYYPVKITGGTGGTSAGVLVGSGTNGTVGFYKGNTAGKDVVTSVVNGQTQVNTAGAEDGRLLFKVMRSGALQDRLAFYETEAVFNDPSNDYDFRIESDTQTHALFVDAGNSRVGINQSAPQGVLQITGSLGSATFGTTGNILDFSRAGANYIRATDAVGSLSFSSGGVETLALFTGGAVFNDPGNDYDFRVESDTNTHALFVDAGNSRVGINNSTPDAALTVNTASYSEPVQRINGLITYVATFSKPASTAKTAVITTGSYFCGRVTMTYNHSNGGTGNSAYFEGYLYYNSSSIELVTISSDHLASTNIGTITLTTDAVAKTLTITFPAGNTSPGTAMVRVESAQALANFTVS